MDWPAGIMPLCASGCCPAHLHSPVWATYSMRFQDAHQPPNRQCLQSTHEQLQAWSLDDTEWKQLTFSKLGQNWKLSPLPSPLPPVSVLCSGKHVTCYRLYFTLYFCSYLQYLPLYSQIIPFILLIHILAKSPISHETIFRNLCLIIHNTVTMQVEINYPLSTCDICLVILNS